MNQINFMLILLTFIIGLILAKTVGWVVYG